MARHVNPIDALLLDDSFDADIYPNESLAPHTTYKIGGPARYLVQVNSISALKALIEACDGCKMPWFMLGRGSNLLVADEGFNGVAIVLGRDFKQINVDVEHHIIVCGAAVTLSAVVQEAFSRGMCGLEFAAGTPGTIGGAVRMNAGSRDAWIGGLIDTVTTYSAKKGLVRYAASDIEWGYRTTSFAPDEVILECELKMEPSEDFFVRGKMEAFLARRRRTQPLNMPSCGSVFKNPDGGSAGALIDEAGLKGFTIGGAQVSDVHANFIVNIGGATAADVRAVIDHVQTVVRDRFGVELVLEVRFLGF